MNAIKAIETIYKGYRFRSRLEARWAMFYDLAGIGWGYETDPVCVNGENYLPDFLVTLDGRQISHEVKPPTAIEWIKPQKVYLAGKMRPEHDWRGEASAFSRDHRSGVEDLPSGGKAWINAARPAQLNNTPFNLIGPFPLGCDHGCSHWPGSVHMAETCANMPLAQIVETCSVTIKHADIVCAHFSTADAYGTLVEVGLAKGLGKAVSVTIAQSVADQLDVPNKFSGESHGQHDLWFAQTLADAGCIVSDDQAARAFHADFIRQRTAKEYRKISGIALATGAAALTFGDPYDVATVPSLCLEWGGINLRKLCGDNFHHAQVARAHRFDRH